MRHTITADADAGRMHWGPSPLPHGNMIIGTVNVTNALLVSPAARAYSGNAGATSSLPPSVLGGWARDMRARHGLAFVLSAAEVSCRTWEGYEQGRTMPLATIYRLSCCCGDRRH